MTAHPSTLIIACGALAREITQVIATHGWSHMAVTCLPAHLHNRPDRIPEAVRGKIRATKDRYDRQFVLYGDCGTGGLLDAVLEEEGVERIPGPHCYEFFAGAANFAALAEEEPGTFFLTDFLVRHFDRLIIEGLGLDRYPQLLPDYFGHYRKLVHLAQVEDPVLDAAAKRAALRLGLTHQRRFTGLGGLAAFLRPDPAGEIADGRTDRRLLA
jgi:hypothetical protein